MTVDVGVAFFAGIILGIFIGMMVYMILSLYTNYKLKKSEKEAGDDEIDDDSYY